MAYTEVDIQKQIKPLSKNGFVAFWQRIWRWWLSVWYGFADRFPKTAKWTYMIFFFIVFSEGVTIFQMLVLIFLPHLFGPELAAKEFMWPKIELYNIDGNVAYWSLLGNQVLYKDGEPIIGGGLGYFLAFKIATFLAQVINFPLQRNITYRSHGNPWYQAMWYFIGWVLINLGCDAFNNLWIPLAAYYFPPEIMWLKDILAMISQGGIAMFIFFFIFLVIFPDNEKRAQKAKKKLEAMKVGNVTEAEYAKQEAKTKEYELAALLTKTEKDEISATTLANSRAIKYNAVKKRKVKEGDEQKHQASLEKAFDEACAAIEAKEVAQQARKEALELKAKFAI